MNKPTPWPHAPTHLLGEAGTYFVTGSTYQKAHHFRGRGRVEVRHRGLLTVARDFGWTLEAWAVFSNHYHFVGKSPLGEKDALSLGPMLSRLHEDMAKWVNKLDAAPQRKVWHYWRDSRLTYEKSYLARLAYTHRNAVHHGFVPVANQYPWCSAAWFEREGDACAAKDHLQLRRSAYLREGRLPERRRMVSTDLVVRWQSEERARHRLVSPALCYRRMWFCGWASFVKRRIAPACEGGVALVPRFPPHYKFAPSPSRTKWKSPALLRERGFVRFFVGYSSFRVFCLPCMEWISPSVNVALNSAFHR